MKGVLNEFFRFFGHKVNVSKSTLFFLSNMDDLVNNRVGGVLGFQPKDKLGIYLGVPLFHYRVTKGTFQFVVDKVQKKLNGYVAKSLSLTSRVTLAKFVLLVIPGYFMQLAMIPIRICERIEQIVRRFVWVSITNETKVPLVRWEKCCQDISHGGLRLRRMIPQKYSYLMKLAFQMVTNLDTLWVRILRFKYKVVEICPDIERIVCSYVWRSLGKIWGQLRDGIS